MKLKKVLGYFLKLGVSAFAIFYIFKNVGTDDLWETLSSTSILIILLCLSLYILSQWISTHRLNEALRAIDIKVPFIENFRLYFVGMAYNLFLPGGIGGDAYKVVYYTKHYTDQRKKTIAALLYDRLIGLLAIFLLLAVFASMSPLPFKASWLIVFAVVPIFFIARHLGSLTFKSFTSVFTKMTGFSLFVQLTQAVLITALALSYGLNDLPAIICIFFISTIATSIPIFLGGLGAREIVFVKMAQVWELPESPMLSIAVIFSLINVISAIPGLILDWKMKPKAES
ncbi:flippase-like domain-containing protein [bacterium]|nr:flippase-like domain-containing protein [bacterium]